MKIILKEKQLKNINESLGVSESSLAYVNLLYGIIEPKIIEMIRIFFIHKKDNANN